MWIQTSSIGYALLYEEKRELIEMEARYANGTVIVYIKDGKPLLKFERHGNIRLYWYEGDNRYER